MKLSLLSPSECPIALEIVKHSAGKVWEGSFVDTVAVSKMLSWFGLNVPAVN